MRMNLLGFGILLALSTQSFANADVADVELIQDSLSAEGPDCPKDFTAELKKGAAERSLVLTLHTGPVTSTFKADEDSHPNATCKFKFSMKHPGIAPSIYLAQIGSMGVQSPSVGNYVESVWQTKGVEGYFRDSSDGNEMYNSMVKYSLNDDCKDITENEFTISTGFYKSNRIAPEDRDITHRAQVGYRKNGKAVHSVKFEFFYLSCRPRN